MGLSPEYRQYIQSDAWKNRSKWIKSWTLNRDGLLPFLRASQSDHLTYRNMGHELPLRDCIPLHPATHWFVTNLRKFCRYLFGRKAANCFIAWIMRIICFAWLPLIYLFFYDKNLMKYIAVFILGLFLGAANSAPVIHARNMVVKFSITQLKGLEDAQRNKSDLSPGRDRHGDQQRSQRSDRGKFNR